MDIYQFMNSRDAADHLRKIDYHFNCIEAAYFVAMSAGATIEEKASAWSEIIDTMPDHSMGCAPPFYLQCGDTFFGLLRLFEEQQHWKRERFYEDAGYCYQVDLEYTSDFGLSMTWGCSNTFETIQSCMNYLNSLYGIIPDEHELTEQRKPIARYWIRKYLNGSSKRQFDVMLLNETLDPLSIELADMSCQDRQLDLLFDQIWLAIPTPFTRGDLVVDVTKRERERDPFVLSHLSTWTVRGGRGTYRPGFNNPASCTNCMWSPCCYNGSVLRMESYGISTRGRWGLAGTSFACGMGSNPINLEYSRDELDAVWLWDEILTDYRNGSIDGEEALSLYEYLAFKSETDYLREIYDKIMPHEIWQRIRGEEQSMGHI